LESESYVKNYYCYLKLTEKLKTVFKRAELQDNKISNLESIIIEISDNRR